jgi:hypothetical protein
MIEVVTLSAVIHGANGCQQREIHTNYKQIFPNENYEIN